MALTQTRGEIETARLLQDGAAAHRAGDLAAAERAYRKVLRRKPEDPDALHLLGVVVSQKGNGAEGLGLIQKALGVREDFPDAHVNAAVIFNKKGEPERAELHLRRALHHRPSTVQAHHILGHIHRDRDRLAEAIASFQSAVRWDPCFIDGHVELARTYRISGDIAAMATAITTGLQLAPAHPTLLLMASELAFGRGELPSAWRNYRRRFEAREKPVAAKKYPLPHWDGGDLTGKSILIWTEQAPGDEILYAGMFSEVIARAGRCVIQCSPRVVAVFRRSFPGATFIDRDLAVDELADIAVQCSAADLGEYLRPRLDSFPRHHGYLRADENLRQALRAKYQEGDNTRVLVGISWRTANADHAAGKSVSILLWGPVLHIPGVTFVNLQYGDCGAELEAVRKGFGVTVVQDATINPLGELDPYVAQVAAMDFVVSSSNTAAHVAGGLGIPTACMLPFSLGRGQRWYWFAQQPVCPWYPSLTTFPQRTDGDWIDVIRDAALRLLDFLVERRNFDPVPYLAAMALAFAKSGRAADADVLCRRLERIQSAPAWHAAGNVRKALGDNDAALIAFDSAAAADQTFWKAYNDAGLVLASVGRFEDAIQAYRKGLTHNSDSVELNTNLATALRKLGHAEEAIPHCERALKAAGDADANLRATLELSYSGALDDAGRSEEALASVDRAIAAVPGHVDAHYNRAQGLLSNGHLAEGWREFEWRLKRPAANVRYELFSAPRWRGEDVTGKNVLVWTEQGIGDEILAASMLPDLIARAANVTLLCSARLVDIFRRSFPAARVEERREPLPPAAVASTIDFQMSFADLGAAFRPRLDAFPARRSFLAPDPARRETLRRKYTALRPGAPVVGLCWSSLRNYEIGWLKSIDLLSWAPILKMPDVTFVSLQYGERVAELQRVRERLGVDVVSDPEIDALKDMDGFAAQTAAMDLVISISNTTVHTAGALGIPVWVLLAQGRGRLWYWFRGRTDSPWYPSARLFRQERSGDWTAVVNTVAGEFGAWTRQRQR